MSLPLIEQFLEKGKYPNVSANTIIEESKSFVTFSYKEFDAFSVVSPGFSWDVAIQNFITALEDPEKEFMSHAIELCFFLPNPDDLSKFPLLEECNKKDGVSMNSKDDSVATLSNPEKIYYTVLALVTTRAIWKSADTISTKMAKIEGTTLSFYRKFMSSNDITNSMKSKIPKIERSFVAGERKQHLAIAMIRCCIKKGQQQSPIKGLLDWAIMQSTMYIGMNLVSIAAQCMRMFHTDLQRIAYFIGNNRTAPGFIALAEFYSDKNRDVRAHGAWVYCRMYGDFFYEFTYAQNTELIGIMLKMMASSSSDPNVCDIYDKFLSPNLKRQKLGKESERLADAAAKELMKASMKEGAAAGMLALLKKSSTDNSEIKGVSALD